MATARLLLSPFGRIGRRSYWIGLAALAVITLVLIGAIEVLLRRAALPAAFAIAYALVCLTTKRLRDAGRPSAWAATPFVLAAAVLAGLAATGLLTIRPLTLGAEDTTRVAITRAAALAATLACAAYLLILGLLPARNR